MCTIPAYRCVHQQPVTCRYSCLMHYHWHLPQRVRYVCTCECVCECLRDMRLCLGVKVENVVRGESHRQLTLTEASLCSLLGGSLSALATIPFDVLVSVSQSAGQAGQVSASIDLYLLSLSFYLSPPFSPFSLLSPPFSFLLFPSLPSPLCACI